MIRVPAVSQVQDIGQHAVLMSALEIRPIMGVPEHNVDRTEESEITAGDEWLCTAACILSGTSTFFVYYQMALSFVALDEYIWPGQVFTNLLGGSEYMTAAIVSFISLPYNGFRLEFFYVSSVIYVLSTISFPLIVTFLPGMNNFKVARGLLVCVSLLTGLGDGLQGLAGFSMAASMPRSRVGYISGGTGFSGLIPFSIFVFLSQVVFDRTIEGQTALIWAFFSCGTVLSMMLLVCITLLNHREWFRRCVLKAKLHHESQYAPGVNRWKQVFLCNTEEEKGEENSKTDVEGCDVPARNFKAVIKDCGLHAFSALFLITITMMLFPIVAPLGFHQNYTWRTILNGIGQIGHTTMRFAPIYFAWLHIKRSWLLPVITIRCLFFFPLFLVIARMPSIPELHDPWFLSVCMIVFSALHGWAGTLTDIYCISSVSHPQEKAMASKVLVIAQMGACAIGQFAGNLTVL